MTKALVFIAHGSEEMEVVIIVDVLRRAKFTVDIFGVELNGESHVTCSRNIKIIPDFVDQSTIDWDSYNILIIPGGLQGTETLRQSSLVLEKIKEAHAKDKWVAAVCAGSLVIKEAQLGRGGKITSHPSVKEKLNQEYSYSNERVVVDGKIITSRGPGTCFELALEIASKFIDSKEVNTIHEGLILPQV